MNFLKHNCFFLLSSVFVTLVQLASGQISGIGHYLVKPAQYTVPSVSGTDTIWITDSIYVFHTPIGNGWPVNARLQATIAGQSDLRFTWWKFNPVKWQFSDSLRTDSLTDVSVIQNLASGGYLVHVTGNHIDTIMRAWVFTNYFQARLRQNNSCDEVEFTWFSGPQTQSGKSFRYYYWNDSSTYVLQNGLKISWSACKYLDNGTLVPDTLEFIPVLYPKLTLYDDHRFYLTINDSLNNRFADSIDFMAIAVKPSFRASRAKPYPHFETDTTGEAPFRVMFIDSSLNTERFTWVFHKPKYLWKDKTDTVISIFNEKILSDSILYIQPGNYDVELIAEGPRYYVEGEARRCRVSLRKTELIQIDSSFIGDPKAKDKIANVFTPNNDGRNDYFKPVSSDTGYMAGSLMSFEVYIFTRWGNRIYHFKARNQDDYHDWPGWNGKIGGDGMEAAPGIYFYVIRGKGYDGLEHARKGFVYLIRSVNDMKQMSDM